MSKRYCAVFCIIILLCISLTCCAKKKKTEDNSIKIGFSTDSQTFLIERWNKDIKVFTNVARELGAEVILTKSSGKDLGQIPQIQYLVEQDVDVLVVIPEDMDILAGVIKKTMEKGIPVLAYDRPIMGTPITGYISFDNFEVGRLLASALTAKVSTGNYLIVNGSVRDNNSYELNRGIHAVIDPFLHDGAITLIDEIWLEEWAFDEAREKIGQVFKRTTNIDAICCSNDLIADAAISILSERQLAGKVAVVGQDADLLSCQRVVEGTQLMTVYKPLHKLAGRAAEIAVQMVRGIVPEPEQYIDNQSGEKIPFYVEKPIAVFKDNIDETVIRDGFHSRDDVYRNLQN
ncbi:MAG TPA: substrate-binding domain-containing protein [Spirochaetia bacterium]|nr:substrate-binding domain-containing protein [Spirochaetia bacterium]